MRPYSSPIARSRARCAAAPSASLLSARGDACSISAGAVDWPSACPVRASRAEPANARVARRRDGLVLQQGSPGPQWAAPSLAGAVAAIRRSRRAAVLLDSRLLTSRREYDLVRALRRGGGPTIAPRWGRETSRDAVASRSDDEGTV